MTTTPDGEISQRSVITACQHITSLTAFDELTKNSSTEQPIAIQGVDLCSRTDALLSHNWQQTTFLGCPMTIDAEHHANATGATIFPVFEGLPYEPYRGSLYTTAELKNNDLDGRIYQHQARWRNNPPPPILEALAQRVHDHAIDDALNEFLSRHDKVVAVMGGHSLHRDQDTYRAVAETTRALTRSGYLVVTGGGPGAMEAGNLGAWMAAHPNNALDEAINTLSEAVDYSTSDYLDVSAEVTGRFPHGSTSLAIPTWFYGHEPTNDFATDVAKYFSNSIREDGLLAIATHGVVYTPGAAGTIQEVFMDATQNHYAVFGVISPMVFLDSAYWADDRLAAPLLLRQLAADKPYADMIGVFDDSADVIDFIINNPPVETP